MIDVFAIPADEGKRRLLTGVPTDGALQWVRPRDALNRQTTKGRLAELFSVRCPQNVFSSRIARRAINAATLSLLYSALEFT